MITILRIASIPFLILGAGLLYVHAFANPTSYNSPIGIPLGIVILLVSSWPWRFSKRE